MVRKIDFAVRKFKLQNYDWSKFDSLKIKMGVKRDEQVLRRAISVLEEHLIKERYE